MLYPPFLPAVALALAAAGCLMANPPGNGVPSPQTMQLKVSENRRYLVYENGKPFFFLGDTAWELFHRTTREEADRYLEDRARKGFTVIQAVALAEEDGLHTPNSYGQRPLIDDDPTRPDLRERGYWEHVDYVINKAASLGLYIGLVPTWGDKWNNKWGVGPVVFNPENARIYGEWLARRYKDKPLIWILGGDRPLENETHYAIVRAMAEGVRAGDGGRNLITLHPCGRRGSAEYVHNDTWLDFNMRQNGHVDSYPAYAETLVDYRREPNKPVIDAEPIYEDHPISFDAAQNGHSLAADVRRCIYWDLFNGSFGITYGHHSIWQFYQPDRKPVNLPLMPWTEALDQPGASQMRHTRRLLEARPFLTRIPDPSLLVAAAPESAWPGAGRYRAVATRDESGSYAMVYTPAGRKFTVRTGALSGDTLRAWWFNPRDGSAQPIGEFSKAATKEFVPPTPGETLDWVLVLDDASRNYPAP